jgi:methylglyoxal synthase/L-amino acid N-acyltransferase YncA
LVGVAEQRDAVASARLDHVGGDFGGAEQRTNSGGAEQRTNSGGAEQRTNSGGAEAESAMAGAQPSTRRPALALTAEGPRRADLIAWAGAHREALASMRLLAPSGIGALIAEHVGLFAHPLRSGTMGPAATAALAAGGDIDAMVAFSDPIELRPGDTTTRSLTRLAVFWDIPIAGNRATADLLLATLVASSGDLPDPPPSIDVDHPAPEPIGGAVQLWNVRATVDDVPGRLAILAASLARRAINILSVQVHLTPDGPVDELLVAASPVLTGGDLIAAVVDSGARNPRVTRADAHALVDGPTRALTLATRLVRSPDDLPGVLISLLPGAQLVWRAEAPAGHEDNLTEFWLADPTGGGYLLTRPPAPFTPAERARAYAMVDLATLAQARPTSAPIDTAMEPWRVVLVDGTEVIVRPAAPDDLDRVVELHGRCSMTTRLRRYLGGSRTPSEATLGRMLAPANGHTLVVENGGGRIVAMASLMWTVNDGEVGTCELAVLVEDAWQQRRLGTLLTRRLLGVAERAGMARVQAVVHASNAAMIRIVTALCAEPGRRLHREYDGGVLTLIVGLTAPVHAPR